MSSDMRSVPDLNEENYRVKTSVDNAERIGIERAQLGGLGSTINFHRRQHCGSHDPPLFDMQGSTNVLNPQ